jgi:hypothetical protein
VFGGVVAIGVMMVPGMGICRVGKNAEPNHHYDNKPKQQQASHVVLLEKKGKNKTVGYDESSPWSYPKTILAKGYPYVEMCAERSIATEDSIVISETTIFGNMGADRVRPNLLAITLNRGRCCFPNRNSKLCYDITARGSVTVTATARATGNTGINGVLLQI